MNRWNARSTKRGDRQGKDQWRRGTVHVFSPFAFAVNVLEDEEKLKIDRAKSRNRQRKTSRIKIRILIMFYNPLNLELSQSQFHTPKSKVMAGDIGRTVRFFVLGFLIIFHGERGGSDCGSV